MAHGEKGFASYLSMNWTTEYDECEAGCGQVMGPDAYFEGHFGHFCSHECADNEEPECFHKNPLKLLERTFNHDPHGEE